MQLSGVSSVQKWHVPSVGWYKLNVDVAVDVDRCRVGYNSVICNNDRQVIVVGLNNVFFQMM